MFTCWACPFLDYHSSPNMLRSCIWVSVFPRYVVVLPSNPKAAGEAHGGEHPTNKPTDGGNDLCHKWLLPRAAAGFHLPARPHIHPAVQTGKTCLQEARGLASFTQFGGHELKPEVKSSICFSRTHRLPLQQLSSCPRSTEPHAPPALFGHLSMPPPGARANVGEPDPWRQTQEANWFSQGCHLSLSPIFLQERSNITLGMSASIPMVQCQFEYLLPASDPASCCVHTGKQQLMAQVL